MTKPFLVLISATVTISALACGRPDVQVISSTTTPSTVAASPPGAPTTAVVRGTIDSIDAAARTITVHGSLVSVPAATSIHAQSGSLTFADLKVGETVEIVATQSGSALTASEIVVNANGDQVGRQIQIAGSIAALQGSCPLVTFSIGATAVSTTARTTFVGSACSQLANGTSVSVDGTLQSDGAIVATRVSLRSMGLR